MSDVAPQPKFLATLSQMPLSGLEILRASVDREISARHHAERLAQAEAERATLAATAHDRPAMRGVSARPRRPLQAVRGYRHPDDVSITWSGLGRRPGWLHDLLARGIALEALAIRDDVPLPAPA
jgi:DNA-binding protein H-NS